MIEFSDKTKKDLQIWEKMFKEYNSHTNLMSKNDIPHLFEKHVADCLAISNWNGFSSCKKILDVGCGGGFPSLILAICYKDKKIIANDSRIKKINFIREVKNELKLDNLEILYSRIEEAPIQNADLITSRAVGSILKVYELSKKHLKNKGHFVFYKSKTESEIEEFKKKYNLKIEVIPYKLPLKEDFERNIVVI